MFKIGSGELRATFLGNHTSEATEQHDNTARHYANEQRAATHQHGGHHTRYEALHLLRDTAPLRGATPVTRHHTPHEALHPLRGTTPDQKRCTAYGSGATPNHKNKRGICETIADTHKAPGARAGAPAQQQLSQRSTSRRRGRPRR